MDTVDKAPQVVPFFYMATVENPTKSQEAGRPIFDEVEMVEYRLAGDRYFSPHFPAHSMHVRENGEEVTHAMRWPSEYQRFKNNEVQVASGTPLEELSFLSAARRSELKALKIYTAEALASLEGPNLKVLAGEGYKLKEQAQAYLDKANGFAGVAALASENAELRERLAVLEKALGNSAESVQAQVADAADPYEGLSDDELKDKLQNLTGTRPRGNPNRQTLTRMLDELQQDVAA